MLPLLLESSIHPPQEQRKRIPCLFNLTVKTKFILIAYYRNQGGDPANEYLILGGEAAMWSEQVRDISKLLLEVDF